jgi:hypothetical protein
MILHVKDLKNCNRKLLYLINTFSNKERYKINILKSVAFPYINNELSEKGN